MGLCITFNIVLIVPHLYYISVSGIVMFVSKDHLENKSAVKHDCDDFTHVSFGMMFSCTINIL